MGMPDRQLLVMTVVISLVAAAVTLVTSGGDWVAVLISLPIFVTFSFWSLRISRWLARRLVPQPQPPEPQVPTEPTSPRPEHARRRRRRRRRGRR